MAENNNNITYFAETNFRNEKKNSASKRRDRARHMYVIGKTGVGQDHFDGKYGHSGHLKRRRCRHH